MNAYPWCLWYVWALSDTQPEQYELQVARPERRDADIMLRCELGRGIMTPAERLKAWYAVRPAW
jgi:hypothetical protein